jgi:thiamine kinase-like enzyme
MRTEFEALFTRIPLLEDKTPAAFTITPLPGYTNRNFRLHNQQHDWVLRIPLPDTNRFIDREAEAVNQACASELGIAPRPAWRDDTGLSLTPTLSASRGITSADLTDRATLSSIVEVLRQLHHSECRFRGRVQIGSLLSRYYAMLDPALQHQYRHRMQAARELIPLLEDRDCDYVASHNDLVLENLLLGPDRPWLIDWEFSAMASPYWDLATLCNAAGFDYRQSVQLLGLYCAGGAQMEESLLFDYRNLLQLLGDCWMAALVN